MARDWVRLNWYRLYRLIATIFLSNRFVRACVGLFVVTLFFALRTLVELNEAVDQLNTAV